MERVVVTGVDRSARSRIAAEWAAHEALLRGVRLRVVHVTPGGGPDTAELWPYRPETLAARVAAELTARQPALHVDGVRLAGAPASTLRRYGTNAQMIVLGLRGESGPAGPTPGSTALAVAGAASCPVVLVPSEPVRTGTAHRPGKVTLAIDARAPVGRAVDFAFDAAQLRGVRLHALHAGAPPAVRTGRASRSPSAPGYAARVGVEMTLLSDALRPWRGKYPGVRVLENVALCDPAKALLRASRNTTLMVLGRGLADGLGTVSYAVAQRAKCPLAVVRA